jgi:hypothetical protein
MDYHGLMNESRQKFHEDPRRSIENLIRIQRDSPKNLASLGMMKSHPELLLLFNKVHLEYALLCVKLYSKFDANDLINDDELIGTTQRIAETMSTLEDCATTVNEVNALRLARCFAAYQELIWKKLKKIVRLAGLNPSGGHLWIPQVGQKLKEIEDKFGLKISALKSIVDPVLRNPVGHEDTVFVAPNTILFKDTKHGKPIEVKRMTLDELKYEIAKFTAILGAIQTVELGLVISRMEPLLKLSDDQLKEYMKTGIMTKEMLRIIEEST